MPAADDTIRSVLGRTGTWAVVGCSPDPARDSNRIARMMRDRGHPIVPVNPAADEVLGQRCFSSLTELPPELEVDVVDIFRRPDQAGPHVDEAIAIGASAVWMQLGVVDAEAARRAQGAGLDVVMDRCPAIEIPRLGLSRRLRGR